MALLIGVEHVEENTERVIHRLSRENLENKKVMLEIYSYPVSEDVGKINLGFKNFWDGIGAYVKNQGGLVVCGEDKELYYKVLKKMSDLGEEDWKLWQELRAKEEAQRERPFYLQHRNGEFLEGEWKKIEELSKKLCHEIDYIVPLAERDPHFAKVANEEKPGIILLGYYHIPYLVENCFPNDNYSLIYVPPSL